MPQTLRWGLRNLDKWERGKIALKLKPEIEARAKANQPAAGGDKSAGKPLSATLPKGCSISVDTRKDQSASVCLGERTMGKVMQIDEHALNRKGQFANQGYYITQQMERSAS